MSTNCKQTITSIIVVMVVTIFLPIFMYANNAETAAFTELLPVIIGFLVSSVLLFGITLVIAKKIYFSALFTIILTLVFHNYLFMEKGINRIAPQLKYWHIVPILLVIIGHIVYFINKKVSESTQSTIVMICGIVFGGLIIVNLVTAVPAVVNKMRTTGEQNRDMLNSMGLSSNEFPNVYYLLFDEYSNFEVMEKYYHYDNYHFAEFLEDKGFTVSYDTMNGSGNTTTIVTNYFNYDYVVNGDTSEAEKTALLENNKLCALMEENGYKTIGLGDSDFVGVSSILKEGGSGSETIEGYSLQQLLLQQTVLKPFVSVSMDKRKKLILDTFSYFTNPNNYDSYANTFVVSYLCTPHQPFLFDKNGNDTAPKNYNNWDDKKYYVEQYMYITQRITQTIECIMKYDSDCIIILQADHGARFLNGMKEDDKKKPLNAVYYNSINMSEIKGESGVNTIRILLNELFGLDLPIVEVSEW